MIAQIDGGDAGRRPERFLVLYSKTPVCFVLNLCGTVYSLCHMDEATRFDRKADALAAIYKWRLPADFCEVVPESNAQAVADDQRCSVTADGNCAG